MNYSYRRIFSFIWQFVGPYKGKFFFGSFLSVVGEVVDLYPVYAFALLVDFVTNYSVGESWDTVYWILFLWLCSIIIHNVTGFFSKYINRSLGERATMDAAIYGIRHLSLLDMSWHEKENTGNKIRKIENGSRGIIQIVALWTGTVIDMVVSFVGAIVIMFHFDPTLGLMLLVYQIIYYFIASATRERGIRALRQGNIKAEEIAGLWHEIVSNIRSVKALGMSPKLFVYAKEKIEEFILIVKRRIFWFQGSGYAQGLWSGIARVFLILYVINGILAGNYEVGFLILFYGYFNALTSSVGMLTNAAQDIATERANIGRFIELLDEPVRIDSTKGKVNFPKEWRSLHIKNLTFGYGENQVLNNISLEIMKGEKIGIVGLSGAGKSTLFKLLLKEHENYEGEILIGETPLKKIKKSNYTSHIATVLQDTEVFNLSLKQNIVLANSKEEKNMKLLDRSLDIAHVKDFLPKLPQGLETLIGEKGIKLSGGEKQRLGIARAVFKEPQILFLDEATSHLDVESEQKIQDSLKKFFKNVTAVVIAHRLSTIREMDRIIVIENGQIIETGTFDELNALSGRFREFWDKQRM